MNKLEDYVCFICKVLIILHFLYLWYTMMYDKGLSKASSRTKTPFTSTGCSPVVTWTSQKRFGGLLFRYRNSEGLNLKRTLVLRWRLHFYELSSPLPPKKEQFWSQLLAWNFNYNQCKMNKNKTSNQETRSLRHNKFWKSFLSSFGNFIKHIVPKSIFDN